MSSRTQHSARVCSSNARRSKRTRVRAAATRAATLHALLRNARLTVSWNESKRSTHPRARPPLPRDGRAILLGGGTGRRYILVAIGTAPWPIGVTNCGIHTRSSRENISSSKVAHVMNNELQRKCVVGRTEGVLARRFHSESPGRLDRGSPLHFHREAPPLSETPPLTVDRLPREVLDERQAPHNVRAVQVRRAAQQEVPLTATTTATTTQRWRRLRRRGVARAEHHAPPPPARMAT